MSKQFFILPLLLILSLFTFSCDKKAEGKVTDSKCSGCPSASSCAYATDTKAIETDAGCESDCFGAELTGAPKITFLELGSTTCIPCKKMEPVLEAIEDKYGDQIEVIFHNVKKDREIAKKFGIRLIPTQIFLDNKGRELFRHEGFFAEKKIDAFLQSKGLQPNLDKPESKRKRVQSEK